MKHAVNRIVARKDGLHVGFEKKTEKQFYTHLYHLVIRNVTKARKSKKSGIEKH